MVRKLEFHGYYECPINEGNLQLPSEYAQTLKYNGIDKICITISGETLSRLNYLILFPSRLTREAYEMEIARIKEMRGKDFAFYFDLLDLDDGEILIPDKFLDYAGIKRSDKVIVAGKAKKNTNVYDRMTVWEPKSFERWKPDLDQTLETGLYREVMENVQKP